MKNLKYKIPSFLLYSRLFVALLMVCFSFLSVSKFLIVFMVIYAVVSDIFDGIIARRLKVSTPELRQLDTRIDTLFWLSCLFYLLINYSAFVQKHLTEIIILVFTELAIVLLGKLKFNERISFHTILSKFWALTILWFFIELVLFNHAYLSFKIVFYYGLLVQAEICLIALILKVNVTDIPFIWTAIKIKNGRKFTRNKWFNG